MYDITYSFVNKYNLINSRQFGSVRNGGTNKRFDEVTLLIITFLDLVNAFDAANITIFF